MMLTFTITAVREVIARGIADAEANGGFRDPHLGLSAADHRKPGLWLVGDHGVYLMLQRRTRQGGEAARRLRRGMRSAQERRLVRGQTPDFRRR